jgi:hypothetical protein
LSRDKRRSEQEAYDKNPLKNTKNMIKSAFDGHTCNISINYAINNSDQLYPQTVSTPSLVLEEISRQAANLFAPDGSQLQIPPDWLEFFEMLPNATYFMRNVNDEISIDIIKSALCSCGADKAPGPSSFTVRHLRNSGVTEYLCTIFNAALRSGITPTDWNKLLMVFIPKSNNPYQAMLTGLRPITLLETIQKVFLKTIFSRITASITANSILKGADSSVLPGTSTYEASFCLLCSWRKNTAQNAKVMSS